MSADARRTQQVMVRLTPDHMTALAAHSAANERTVAQTVRLAIRQYLDSLKETTP